MKNRTKSHNKKLNNKNILINKSASLKNHNKNISNVNKSNNKKTNINNNSKKPKSKKNTFKNNNYPNELNNNYNYNESNINCNNQNYNQFDYNKDIYNSNLNKNYLSMEYSNKNRTLFDADTNNFLENNLCKSKNIQSINNELIEHSNIFKKTLDRLLSTSNNLLEKQNNILTECEILSRNVAMNDYSIETLNKNDINSNFSQLINNYSTNLSTLFSQMKNTKSNTKLNEQLKNENNILRNKLEMLNITQEDNLKIKDSEISNLKIVLVSEINHMLNFLQEIGYDKIAINKMEITDITSQRITNFFELIIKIIKQMKELINKKETIISKMKIEQNTIRDNKDENNKSFERLTFDYTNYNLGLKNYNFSVQNSSQRKKYNISFRNNSINKNLKNEFNLGNIGNDYKSIDYIYNKDINNNKYINDDKKEEYSKRINNINKEKIIGDNEIVDKNKNYNYNNNDIQDININNEKNKDNKMNSDTYFYNMDSNYSYDRGSTNNHQTGAFNQQNNDNNKNNKNSKDSEDEIIDPNINEL